MSVLDIKTPIRFVLFFLGIAPEAHSSTLRVQGVKSQNLIPAFLAQRVNIRQFSVCERKLVPLVDVGVNQLSFLFHPFDKRFLNSFNKRCSLVVLVVKNLYRQLLEGHKHMLEVNLLVDSHPGRCLLPLFLCFREYVPGNLEAFP